MSTDPTRLLERGDVSPAERALLELGRSTPPVAYDAAAGEARLLASLAALGAAQAAEGGSHGLRAHGAAELARGHGLGALRESSAAWLAKIGTKLWLVALAGSGVIGVGVLFHAGAALPPARSPAASVELASSQRTGALPASREQLPSASTRGEHVPSAANRGGLVRTGGARSADDVRMGAGPADEAENAPTRAAPLDALEAGSVGATRHRDRRADSSAASPAPAGRRRAALSTKPKGAAKGSPHAGEPVPLGTMGAVSSDARGEPSAAPARPTHPRAADEPAVGPFATPLAPAPAQPSERAQRTRGATETLRELAAIARARSLVERDPEAALRLLERQRQEFPQPMFAEERAALAVIALGRAGRRALVREQAAVFLRRYPNGPFSDAVRASVPH
jgi:hypothetical protein